MRIDFYTFGGKSTWEDVFIYAQWRIQRHCNLKDYRLLDEFDIKRCSGTFAECQKSFVEFIEAYETERQDPNIVIMLHGLNGSRHDFKKMWQAFKTDGIFATAISYPSTKKRIDAQVRQFNVLLNNLSDTTHVSFIAKGTSGLILRKLLCAANDVEWKKRIKIKRILEICPPNKGSKLFSHFRKNGLIRKLFGPMLDEGSEEASSFIPEFPKGIDLGIISCDSYYKKYAMFLPSKYKQLIPSQVENAIGGPYKSIYIQNKEKNPLENEKIILACKSFIKTGNFN
ncbi:MAG: esterase/lipase family protein [Alphaproteobacteria bacterium]